jgi:hypothetical protein
LTAQPVSLLDLPDELLATIYDQLYHSLRSSAESSPVGVCVPLSKLLVNKRIFNIAQPLFFQHLAFPTDPYAGQTSDEFTAKVLQLPKERSDLITSAQVELSHECPAVQMTALASLHNLEHLVFDTNSADYVPMYVTDALKKLKKL